MAFLREGLQYSALHALRYIKCMSPHTPCNKKFYKEHMLLIGLTREYDRPSGLKNVSSKPGPAQQLDNSSWSVTNLLFILLYISVGTHYPSLIRGLQTYYCWLFICLLGQFFVEEPPGVRPWHGTSKCKILLLSLVWKKLNPGRNLRRLFLPCSKCCSYLWLDLRASMAWHPPLLV